MTDLRIEGREANMAASHDSGPEVDPVEDLDVPSATAEEIRGGFLKFDFKLVAVKTVADTSAPPPQK